MHSLQTRWSSVPLQNILNALFLSLFINFIFVYIYFLYLWTCKEWIDVKQWCVLHNTTRRGIFRSKVFNFQFRKFTWRYLTEIEAHYFFVYKKYKFYLSRSVWAWVEHTMRYHIIYWEKERRKRKREEKKNKREKERERKWSI